jgi:RNA polymerase sigma factor (TIGR02999 family)
MFSKEIWDFPLRHALKEIHNAISRRSHYLPPPVRAETKGKNCQRRDTLFSGNAMASPKSTEITGLLRAWSRGDEKARDLLAAKVYDELRRIARRYIKNEPAGNTLQTTALVNEVYLRLVDVQNVTWENRAQFFAISAQMMRRILVDAARARGSHKRGGGVVKVNVDEVAVLSPDSDTAVLALHDALKVFSQVAPRQAKVVELRYFGGLSVEETREVMKISERTVMRDWGFARAWLMRELSR